MQLLLLGTVVPSRRPESAPLIALVVSTQVFQKRANLRISRVLMQKRFQLSACVWEKCRGHEIYGRGRSFDVEKDGADWRFVKKWHAGYFAGICGGM